MSKFEYCYFIVASYNIHNYDSLPVANICIWFSSGKQICIEGNSLDKALNYLGKDGWEMVGSGEYCRCQGVPEHVLYFKREMK